MTHVDQAVGVAVTLLLLTRSRSAPSLRPAAHACLAFVALDGARLAIDVGGRQGWWAWVDVGLWVGMSGPWAWLLCYDGRKPRDASTRPRLGGP